MKESFCKCSIHKHEDVDQSSHQRKVEEIYKTSKQLTVIVPAHESTDIFENCECSTEGVTMPRIDRIVVENWTKTVINPIHGEVSGKERHLLDEDYSRQLEEGYGAQRKGS